MKSQSKPSRFFILRLTSLLISLTAMPDCGFAQLPTINILATDSAAGELNNTGLFTITRTEPITAPLTVNFWVGGSATAGADYMALGNSVIIPAGAMSATKTVTPIDDPDCEGTETVVLNLRANAAYALGASRRATVVIADNDPPSVSIVASDAAAGEPNDPGLFTVTRTGPTTGPLTVSFSVSGTATPDADYVAFAPLTEGVLGNVAIPAGAASATIAVTLIDDQYGEPTESIVVALQGEDGYTLGSPGRAGVTISDDDRQAVSIVATDPAAAEPNDNGLFTITRTGPTTAALTIFYELGGTAVQRESFGTPFFDYYVPKPCACDEGLNQITIPPGTASVNLQVVPRDDPYWEGLETVIMTLRSDPLLYGYDVGSPSSATVVIADNELPAINISGLVNAGEPSANGSLIVTRSGPPTGSLSVNFTVGGVARSAVDYTALGTGVTIPDGAESATLTVRPIDDPDFEGPESITVTLSASPAYLIGSPGNATIFILDNDPPTVNIAATDAIAGEPSDTGLFTVTRAGPTTAPLTVYFAVSGSAKSGVDYAALGTSLTIPAGAPSATLTVRPIDDTSAEVLETVIVTLSASPTYTIGPTRKATVNVSDNDFPLSLTRLNSSIPPSTLVAAVNQDKLLLTLSGQADQIYVVESSDNLTDWAPISTNVQTGDSVKLETSFTPHIQARFYRAIRQAQTLVKE
jgi:hypothetical protein